MGRLEEKYNLIEQNPLERVLSEPTTENLRFIPKASQTEEMLIKVCKQDGCALKFASKRKINELICEIAVNQNGAALQYIPSKIFESARKKYSDDSWATKIYENSLKTYGCALEFIPEKYITREMVIQAITVEKGIDYELDRYPIAFIPSKFKKHDIYLLSVETSPHSIKDINDKRLDYLDLVQIAINKNGEAIKHVREKFLNKKFYLDAINNNPLSLKYVPQKYITKEICRYCFEKCFLCFAYIPSRYISEDMCIKLINDRHFSVFPDFFDQWNLSREKNNTIDFSQFPNHIHDRKSVINEIIKIDPMNARRLFNWNEKIKMGIIENKTKWIINARGETLEPLKSKTLKLIKKTIDNIDNKLPIEPIMVTQNDKEFIKEYHPDIPKLYTLVPSNNTEMIIHDLSDYEYSAQNIYYISDIHIEHQIGEKYISVVANKGLTNKESNTLIQELIETKISEMMVDDDSYNKILLIGGDVASNKPLSDLFYECLLKRWKGFVISVLGNHEFWDGAGADEYEDSLFKKRKSEDIVKEYQDFSTQINRDILGAELYFLENEIFIIYKNRLIRKVSEEDLKNSSEEELKSLLSGCSLIILGGVGYSGRNPIYNSNMGLYHKTIDMEADRKKSENFKFLHDKIARCVSDKKVIVLTHTPVYDWMPEKNCIPNWIYVNGHTHINALCRNDNGSVVLADNQVGYEPSKWKLNSIKIDYWYDPFERYEDGIYEISSEQYKEFYTGRGVSIKGCNFPGTLYVLKKSGIYMFILESDISLCLMVGGRRKKLEYDNIDYYFDNMDVYGKMIQEIIKPYQNALENISKEIKQFGGTGTIHGCIVDISYFSHIYINPYDGKVTPYWAFDISRRRVYPNVEKLLNRWEPDLYGKYLLATEKHSISLLEELSHKQINVANVPEWIIGTDIYKESRIMRSIQYVWQHNVIRIWNEDVFEKTNKRNERIEKSKNNIIDDSDVVSEKALKKRGFSKNPPNKYVGQVNTMKNGKEAIIISYKNNWDIKVLLDDGRIVEHRTIWEFNRGNIE